MSPRTERGRLHPGAVPALVVALAAVQLAAFAPGVVTPDGLAQYGQALSGRYEDWHPPVMAWIWRQLTAIHRGQMPFLVMDALLYWGGVAMLGEALRRRAKPGAALAVVAVAALPIPFGQMGSILKDALLAACCLAASGLIALPARPAVARIAAAALLVIAAATRFNAVFAAAPLLAATLPPRWTRRTMRQGGAVVAGVALLATSGWLIDGVALRPVATHPLVSLVTFDLAGIVAHGGDLAIPPHGRAETRALVAECYTPAHFSPHDTAQCNAVQDALIAWPGDARRLWLGAILRHPLAWAEHRLAQADVVWRALLPAVPDDAVYIMKTPDNDLGLSFRAGPAAMAVYRAASVMAASPFGRPATWLAVAAALLAFAPVLPSRRLVAPLALSALLYGGAYAVVSVSGDMRYDLWTMLAAMLALAIAAGELRHVPRAGMIVAAGVIGGLMLAETLWLVLALPALP